MLKFGERYYNDWFGNVYRIILDGEEVGVVDYEEEGNELYVNVLSFIHGYKDFNYFEEAVNILRSMFPEKKLTGLAGPVGCYCGDPEDWEALGAVTRPDPDDCMFTIFELEN